MSMGRLVPPALFLASARGLHPLPSSQPKSSISNLERLSPKSPGIDISVCIKPLKCPSALRWRPSISSTRLSRACCHLACTSAPEETRRYSSCCGSLLSSVRFHPSSRHALHLTIQSSRFRPRPPYRNQYNIHAVGTLAHHHRQTLRKRLLLGTVRAIATPFSGPCITPSRIVNLGALAKIFTSTQTSTDAHGRLKPHRRVCAGDFYS
jgi:hypothetical protein